MQLQAALEVIIRILLKGQSMLQQPSVIFLVRPHIPLNGGAMLGWLSIERQVPQRIIAGE
jgi:hypothetical protein